MQRGAQWAIEGPLGRGVDIDLKLDLNPDLGNVFHKLHFCVALVLRRRAFRHRKTCHVNASGRDLACL